MDIAPVQEKNNIKHTMLCAKYYLQKNFVGPNQTKQEIFQLHPPEDKYMYMLFIITTPAPSAVGQSKVVTQQISVRHGKQPTMN